MAPAVGRRVQQPGCLRATDSIQMCELDKQTRLMLDASFSKGSLHYSDYRPFYNTFTTAQWIAAQRFYFLVVRKKRIQIDCAECEC